MHAMFEHLQNPLMRTRNASDRVRLSAAFPSLQLRTEMHFLALRRYLDSIPEKFYDRRVYQTYLDWFRQRDKTDRDTLRDYLSQHDVEINRALLFLREINSAEWHDRLWRTGDEHDYNLVQFIDTRIHPTYLRLIEAVLNPLIRPIAYFSRLDRGKGTDGLDVFQAVQELKGGPADCLVQFYQHIVRNAIAHGGITFLDTQIRYQDKKGNEETFDNRTIVRLFDDLLDTCNGLVASLKLFFLTSRDFGYIAPRELLVEELREETLAPWWSIEGCVESEIAGKSQLIIYARPNSRHYPKVQWSTIQSGILAEYFAPGYDRYFLTLRSPKALPGWAAFDGTKLRSLRETGANDLAQYKGVIENDLVFYVPQPALPELLGTLDTYFNSFRIHLSLALENIREIFRIPRITCRHATVHRNSWGVVLNAEVVIEDINDTTAAIVIRRHRRRIVASAMRHARKAYRFSLVPYLPIAYAHVAVFRRDYRQRRLSGFGLGDDLICTLRLQRMRRIKSPDIIGSTVETMGNWRIAWNRAWRQATGQE